MTLVCSTRPGALGPVVAQWLHGAVEQAASDLEVELVPISLAELALPFLDEEEHPSSGRYARDHTRRWSELVDSVDGFIVITPEYNYGMPASLKNALDYLGREWLWKPMGFVSYGNTSAGTRSVQHAKQVITTLRIVPLGSTVSIRIGESFRDGSLVADPARDAAAIGLLTEVTSLSRALKPMRDAALPHAVHGPIPGSVVRRLTGDDAADVLVLQRCAWVDEALANDTLEIGALHESLDDVRDWLRTWNAWGLWLDGRLVGMVRAHLDQAEWHIGRLAAVPDLRGRGIGRWLLSHAEAAAPNGAEVAVLHTGARSVDNIRLYESAGYVLTGEGGAHDVRMDKPLLATTLAS